MGTRPTTYVEWRAVYQSCVYWLGLAAARLEGLRRKNAPSFFVQRAVRAYWRRYLRLQRVERRLDAEHEAMDDTYLEEIERMVMDDEATD